MIREIQIHLDETIPTQTSEERGDIRLVFHELLFNAAIHGNQNDKTKKIHVKLSVEGSRIRARITDEGSGYNYHKREPQFEDGEPVYLETGRGMKLVHALTDSVAFEENGRCVSFEKCFGASNG